MNLDVAGVSSQSVLFSSDVVFKSIDKQVPGDQVVIITYDYQIF